MSVLRILNDEGIIIIKIEEIYAVGCIFNIESIDCGILLFMKGTYFDKVRRHSTYKERRLYHSISDNQ